MKLKTIITLCTALSMSLPVYAKSNDEFNVYTSRTGNKISRIEAEFGDGSCVAAIYLSDNTLFSAVPIEMKNGSCDTEITYPNENYTMKLYYNIGSDNYLSISSAEIKYIPEQSNTDNTETKPDEKPTDTPDKLPVIENTDSNDNKPATAATLGSLAVVKEAGTYFDEEYNAVLAYIDILYRGQEMKLKLEEDYRITDASDKFPEMAHQSVTSLKEGDIITLRANLSGSLTGIKFEFRPPAKDAVSLDDDSVLFTSDDSIMFGIITDKLNNDVIVLNNQSGKYNEAVYLDIEPETAIYYYDSEKRSNKLSLADSSDIIKSEIPAADYDDNENITNWSDDCMHNYAYVRLYDGIVCDIVVYGNYITK